MKKKFFILTIVSLFLITLCSYSFATNNMMDNARNAVGNAGNSISNAAATTMNTIGNGVQGLANGAATLGNDAMNGARDMGNDTMNTLDTTATTLGTGDADYTATRTATNTNLFGLSDTAWTWLILGIVGISIVSLVWYYGAQYDHKNYSND